MDSNNFVAGIFFDLAKAFDSLNHSILLDKLYSYGIRGKMHEWIKSYISGRSQITIVSNNGKASPHVVRFSRVFHMAVY